MAEAFFVEEEVFEVGGSFVGVLEVHVEVDEGEIRAVAFDFEAELRHFDAQVARLEELL
ncbi:MAG: hypothetical protein OXG74_13695 [Acidobacteria bacterium]|nr:hypothetical protein [Acidobacteriota bacterium]